MSSGALSFTCWPHTKVPGRHRELCSGSLNACGLVMLGKRPVQSQPCAPEINILTASPCTERKQKLKTCSVGPICDGAAILEEGIQFCQASQQGRETRAARQSSPLQPKVGRRRPQRSLLPYKMRTDQDISLAAN